MSLKDVLHSVDPNLTVVSGAAHRHKATTEEFVAATGPTCSDCGKEYQRGRDGLCYPCWEKAKDSELEIRDKTGIFNWFPQSILAQITHQARKPKE